MATIEEQIAAAEAKAEEARKRLKQLKARKEQQDARELHKMLKGQRTADTRRKILVGSMMLAMVDRGEWSADQLLVQLGRYLTRADDRALFDLPPEGHEHEEAPDFPPTE